MNENEEKMMHKLKAEVLVRDAANTTVAFKIDRIRLSLYILISLYIFIYMVSAVM